MVVPPKVWRPRGGHLALDLCNTVSRRFVPAELLDRLATMSDLVHWHRLAFPTSPPLAARDVDERDVAQVRALRDATTAVLDAHVTGSAIPDRALAAVVREYRDYCRSATPSARLPLALTAAGTGFEQLRRELAAAAVDLLQHADVSRLKRCEGEGCGWFFLDQTRNRSRRWCDSTDCGNRHRVREYAKRHADLN